MIPQDWIFGLLGGGLIGCAAALYLLINGRIMGASGIVGGVIDGTAGGQRRERLAFLLGLVGVPAILALLTAAPDTHLTENLVVLIAAGFLVGLGTRLANGCTSGHGVCGISRLSWRGIVASGVYIGAGIMSVALFRHVLGVI